jgi:mannose-6-phosphate isomerase-like protein (cupin superfamily)
MTETEYRARVTEKGYGEPMDKFLAANVFNDTHTHDVALFLYVFDGEITVEVEAPNGTEKTTCGPGQTVEVPAGLLHTERSGTDGVTFLVARK